MMPLNSPQRLDCLSSTESSLSQSREDSLKAIALEAAADGIVILNDSGKIDYGNPKAIRLFGYSSSQQLIGKSWQDLLVPDEVERFEEQVWPLVHLHGQWQGESIACHTRGSSFEVDLTLSRMPDGETVLVGRNIAGRKRQERSLEYAVQNYREIVERSIEGIFQASLEGRYLSANLALAKMLGYVSPQELMEEVSDIGLQLYADPSRRKELLQLLHQQGTASNFEAVMLANNGQHRWISISARTVFDAKGNILYYEGTARDITPLKRAQLDLQERESAMRNLYAIAAASDRPFSERLHRLLDMGCRSFGLEFGILFQNDGEHHNKAIASIAFDGASVDDSSLEFAQAFCRKALETNSSVGFERASQTSWSKELYRKALPIEAYLGTPVSVGGKVYGTLNFYSFQPHPTAYTSFERELLLLMAQWVGVELERQQAKESLERQYQRALLLRELTQDIRRSLDSKIILQTTVTRLGKMFGVDRCHVHSYDVEPIPQLPIVAEYLSTNTPSTSDRAIPVQGNPFSQEVLACEEAVTMANVFEDPISIAIAPFCQAVGIKSMLAVRTSYGGKPNGIVVLQQCSHFRNWQPGEIEFVEEIAIQVGIALAQAHLLEEADRARQIAEAANRAKSAFLAVMSHEIRTPMNAVIGMTSLLLDTPLNDQQQDFVRTIRTSGDALLTVINDILDFSKIESGQLELEEHPFDIHCCIEDTLDLFAPLVEKKGLELVGAIDRKVPASVLGDVTRLRQIVVNLIGNAIKFTERGEVTISVDVGDGGEDEDGTCTLQFAVRDTGIGIPQERLNRLFKPFSQVDASTTRQYGGSGLGLAICKRLCEMMGGRIWVESERDRGSVFYFTICCCVDRKAEETSTKDLLAFPDMRVLVVDDNATNRSVLSEQLWGDGRTVESAASGAEALEKLREESNQYHLAIVDKGMPDMDGLKLAELIRTLPRHQNLPLILMTSVGAQEPVDTVPLLAQVKKPVKKAQLCKSINTLLGHEESKSQSPSQIHLPNDTLIQHKALSILLVEDHSVNQKVACLMLKKLGYRADIANNGLEAVEAVSRQDYDLLLMDIQMPEMDGWEATRQIRSQLPAERQPWIVAMTASVHKEFRDRCFAEGMNDFASKPIQIEGLAQIIERAHISGSHCDSTAPTEASPSTEPEFRFDPAPLQELYDLSGANSQFIEQTVDAFVESSQVLLQSMESALTAINYSELRRAAHTLKSSGMTLGASSLAQFSSELEATADSLLNSDRKPSSDMQEKLEKLCSQIEIETTEACRYLVKAKHQF